MYIKGMKFILKNYPKLCLSVLHYYRGKAWGVGEVLLREWGRYLLPFLCAVLILRVSLAQKSSPFSLSSASHVGYIRSTL